MSNKGKITKRKELRGIVDKIIKLCPELKGKKKFIMKELTKKPKNHNDDENKKKKKEIIVEEITVGDVMYYKDNINNVLNKDAKIVGYYIPDSGKTILYKDVGKIAPTINFHLF